MRMVILYRIAVALGIAGVAAPVLAASPTPTPSPLSIVRPERARLIPHLIKPDIRVQEIWIGPGSDNQFAALGRNPRVGETISLGCELAISGVVASGWKMAWYIDGTETCGEGQFSLQGEPVCEFSWPFTTGNKAFLSYVPHEMGTHTYACRVDVGNAVAESNEQNNVKQTTFTVSKSLLRPGVPVIEKPVLHQLKRGPFVPPPPHR
jgi:hypothetical protein